MGKCDVEDGCRSCFFFSWMRLLIGVYSAFEDFHLALAFNDFCFVNVISQCCDPSVSLLVLQNGWVVTLSVLLIRFLLLILRDKRTKDVKSLLGILVIPGLQPETVQKVRPAIVRLDDFPFGGRKRGLCGRRSVGKRAGCHRGGRSRTQAVGALRHVVRLTQGAGMRGSCLFGD